MKRLSEAEFRNKITWMTFILSCLVVMIHSYNADLFINGEGTGVFAESVKQVQALVSLAVPSIAVPGFFIISSYLFFRDVSWGEIPDKMTRRVRSVLIPYIVWNTLYYFLFIVVSRIPVLSSVAGKGMVVFSLENLADAIINYTYNPVLWYMQQLILLIALAQAVYAVMSNLWAGGAAIAVLLYFLGKATVIPVLNLDALLYFSSGAYLALHGRRLAEKRGGDNAVSRLLKWAVVLACVLLCIMMFRTTHRYANFLTAVLYGLLAPVTIWIALPSGRLPAPAPWMKESFFLYAFHFLIVRTINKAASLVLPHTAGVALILYFAVAAAAVLLSWGTSEFLKRKIPPLWKLLSGGR